MSSVSTGHHQTDDKTFLHDWISSTCPDSANDISSGQVRNGEDDDCLAVRFHACCLRALQKISRQLSAIDPGELATLRLVGLERLCSQELGKLYLCGESFTSREVGKALERADELRNSILEVLCGLGLLLVHGKHTVPTALISCTTLFPPIFPNAATRRPRSLRTTASLYHTYI